ncbi:MAG: preprotein translocase subunit SecG, partial [Planctomycetes bacterium]|nr:preprotein translocase subunit SecG [Planctomycetota bacterium]
MGIFLGIMFFLISFFMICAILLQESKGGGLAAMSGAVTDSVMGTRNPLRRITAWLFVLFLFFSLAISFHQNRYGKSDISTGLVAPAADVATELQATPGVDAPAPAPATPAAPAQTA